MASRAARLGRGLRQRQELPPDDRARLRGEPPATSSPRWSRRPCRKVAGRAAWWCRNRRSPRLGRFDLILPRRCRELSCSTRGELATALTSIARSSPARVIVCDHPNTLPHLPSIFSTVFAPRGGQARSSALAGERATRTRAGFTLSGDIEAFRPPGQLLEAAPAPTSAAAIPSSHGAGRAGARRPRVRRRHGQSPGVRMKRRARPRPSTPS